MLRVNRTAHSRGLTLIEVMVAIGVLIILVGGIFLVVQTSLKTVLTVDNNASREDEITNLIDILRSSFRNLPTGARMTGQPLSEKGLNEHLLIIRDAPGFLTWLAQPEAEDTVVLISLRQDDEDAGWRVCLKRFAPPNNFPEEDFNPKNLLRAGAQVPWLELVGDFRKAGVRFFDAKSQTWRDRWDNQKERPALIELDLVSEQVRDRRSNSPIIWVPPVKKET